MTDRIERLRRVKEIFVVASSLDGEEREDYLLQATSDEPELRVEVERLLGAERFVTNHEYLQPGAVNVSSLVEQAGSDPEIGRRIGPYELLERLGAGGMGTVYLAARRDEYRQLVAIKLVKRGMDTEQVLARLRRERQTLAALSHPNIARLLDGGTDRDCPYFVMEYVDGSRITQHCDAVRLTIDERLELFGRVCDAVAYAHDQGIVHRDLKPANILVTEKGEPKLLDFGLARLLNPVLGPTPLDPTTTDQRFLSISYASPEQVRGEVVGKASDVYSLGIVLYELLAGRKPLLVDGLPRGEVERIVTTDRPARPSVAAAHSFRRRRADETIESVPPEEVSGARSTTPAALARELRGDLDTIVQTTLQKEPRLRYDDARELGDDIRRRLRRRPIVARPESVVYRTCRFVQRNWVFVAATVMVILSLSVALTAVSIALANSIRSERLVKEAAAHQLAAVVEATQQRRIAEENRRLSLSKRLAALVILNLIDDPELRILLAIEAVRLSPTPASEYALRVALVASKPRITLEGHEDWVGRSAFSPDGTKIVTASRDGTARVWNAATGDRIAALEGHGKSVYTACFGPGGTRILTAGGDGTARLWQAETGTEIARLIGHEGEVLEAIFDPRERWILTAGEDGTIRRWDAATGAALGIVCEAPLPIHAVIFDSHGDRFAHGGADGAAIVRDAADGSEIGVLRGHLGQILDVGFVRERDVPAEVPDRYLLTASRDGIVRGWDVRAGKSVLILRGHAGPVREAEAHPTEPWIVTASAEDAVRVWDALTATTLRTQGGHAIAFSPDGGTLAVAHHDDTVDLIPWELIAPLEANLEEAEHRVTRTLTESEREIYLTEPVTTEELELLLGDPASRERLLEALKGERSR